MPAEKPPLTADHPLVDADRRRAGRLETEAPSAPVAPRTPDVRAAAVEDTAGALTGTYRPDELWALREDWPS